MSFLKNSWYQKAENESGNTVPKQESQSRSTDIYLTLEEIDKNLPDTLTDKEKELLHEFFVDVQDSIANYVSAVNSHVNARYSDMSHERIQQLDEIRSHAHNGLISRLKTLARLHEKHGIDNSWLNDISKTRDRNEIREWAQQVMQYIGKEND